MSAGIDTIKYTLTNMCGNMSALQTVQVFSTPDSGIITGAYTSVCSGSSITLSNSAVGGTWTSSNSSIVNILVVLGDSVSLSGVEQGIDTIVYTVTNYCGTASTAIPVTVDVLPTPIITGRPFVCMGAFENVDSLTASPSGGTWSTNNINDTITTEGYLTGHVAGLDTITYRLSNSCGTEQAQIEINVLTKWQCDSMASVASVNKNENGNITVYPNPSYGQFTVELPEVGVNATIEIVDMYGKLVETRIITNQSVNKVEFDYFNLLNGTYLIKVVSDDKIYRGKVIILNK